MTLKNSKKWLVILASVGLMAGFQGAALADSSNWLQSLFGGQDASKGQNTPDQKQIQADQAAAVQFQQAYQNDRQALAQAYRSGDRQNIQNLQSAVNTDISHLQANAQDLAKDGVANSYNVPSYPSYQYNQGHVGSDGRRWNHRPEDQYNNGRWHNNHRGWHDNNGRWQQDSQDQRQENWNGQHRRYDSNNNNE